MPARTANALTSGHKAPAFKSPDETGKIRTLGDFKGRKLVLYFYPKDDTSGCTKEACDFNDNLKALEKLDAQVVGISRDSVASHMKFKNKYKLKFPLLADEDGKMTEAYGVWVEKSMYGRKYMGIVRTTFLIDENSKIINVWRKVSVTGHVEQIMTQLQSPAANHKPVAQVKRKKIS